MCILFTSEMYMINVCQIFRSFNNCIFSIVLRVPNANYLKYAFSVYVGWMYVYEDGCVINLNDIIAYAWTVRMQVTSYALLHNSPAFHKPLWTIMFASVFCIFLYTL